MCMLIHMSLYSYKCVYTCICIHISVYVRVYVYANSYEFVYACAHVHVLLKKVKKCFCFELFNKIGK